jgi:hypothetical protein
MKHSSFHDPKIIASNEELRLDFKNKKTLKL